MAVSRNNCELPGSYRLRGAYQIDDNRVSVYVNLFQDKKIVHRFTLSGKADDPDELAAQIVAEVDRHALGGEQK